MKKETKNSTVQEEIKASETADVIMQSEEKKEEVPSEEKEGKVGLLLKEVRQKKGKTIAEISQELCIRKIYLTAIEDSDYDKIPEYPYGIGFIRSYADYLGLDGVNIVQMYKEEAEANLRKNNPYFVMEPQEEATVPSKKYLVISLIAVFAIYFAWSTYNRLNEKDIISEQTTEEIIVQENTDDDIAEYPLKVEDFSTTENIAEGDALPIIDATSAEENNPQVIVKEESFNVEKEVAKNQNKKEKSAEENKPAEVTNPIKEEVLPSAKSVSEVKEDKGLVIKVKKDTWVEVKNDEKLYLSKVLMPGDSYTLPKAANLKLSVGKADGVDVTYNGEIIYNIAPNKKMNISVDDILAKANH